MPQSELRNKLLIFIGIFLIFVFASWRIYQARILSFTRAYPTQVRQKSKVARVTISSLKIDLPVEEGKIDNGVWSISQKGASHLIFSKNPGEGGNIVVYGHNKKAIFGPILWVKKDEKITLIDKDDKEFNYRVVETKIVNPAQIEYVLPKNEEILTLYTCIGFADTKRFIVVAKPEE